MFTRPQSRDPVYSVGARSSAVGRVPAEENGNCHATYLQDITIKNLALVTDQVLELHPGLNIITGER